MLNFLTNFFEKNINTLLYLQTFICQYVSNFGLSESCKGQSIGTAPKIVQLFFIYLSIYLFIHLFIYLFICLFIYLFLI